jgi:hypothetical protein
MSKLCKAQTIVKASLSIIIKFCYALLSSLEAYTRGWSYYQLDFMPTLHLLPTMMHLCAHETPLVNLEVLELMFPCIA